jgi:hypothetical protein
MISTNADRDYTWAEAGRLDLLVTPGGEVCATVTAGSGARAAELANQVRAAQSLNKWSRAARSNARLMEVDGYTDDVFWNDATGGGYTAAEYRKLLGV